MNIPLLINKLGEWNPQLFREIKSRFTYYNISCAVIVSLIIQVALLVVYLHYFEYFYVWRYTFWLLTIIFVFVLLVPGTYLLISDLSKEENKGTLNFIRLTPQSATSIFIGKILGVPSLIYLFVITAIPLHLLCGYLAHFKLISIFSYYLLLIACCAVFYSAALLFSLVGKFLSEQRCWMGSSVVFLFLYIYLIFVLNGVEYKFDTPFAWFRLFNPWDIINVLFTGLFSENIKYSLKLNFFYIPVGKNLLVLLAFIVVHHGICAYGMLQVAGRIFRNQKATILSKKHSYLLTGFIQLMFLGLMMPANIARAAIIIAMLTFINSILFIFIVILLSPNSQHIQKWSIYSHENDSKRYFKHFRQDLIWGEKSPATLAITINLLIATIPVIIWVTCWLEDINIGGKSIALLLVAIYISWLLIFANIIQLLFLSKNLDIYMWAFGSAGVTIFLPIVIASLLHIPEILNVFTVLLTNFTVLYLLNWKFNQQVRVLGESATKALLIGDR